MTAESNDVTALGEVLRRHGTPVGMVVSMPADEFDCCAKAILASDWLRDRDAATRLLAVTHHESEAVAAYDELRAGVVALAAKWDAERAEYPVLTDPRATIAAATLLLATQELRALLGDDDV